MNEIIVGIDLGTTNSEVAIVRDGRVEVIVHEDGKILPSVVGLGEDGALLVGFPARNQYVSRPEHTVRSIKRRMGEDCRVQMGEESYRPQEISAMILRRLKQIAEAHLGQPVDKAVITVPAYFSDTQRLATREAGEIAGLQVVRIINEPTAAALAYESAHQGAKKALIYDLGGGTFDVSVVNIEGDVVEVLASHGNNHLGGDDFDRLVLDHLIAHLRQTHGIEGDFSAAVMARLQRAAETAKIALSERPFVQVSEEFLLEHQGQPVHLNLELDRHEYEAMIAPYIDETLAAVHIALSGARLTVADLDEIILVGGATRTPLVVRRLHDELGVEPHGEVDPDLCVAMGAAIAAALIAGGTAPTILIDVTPYTFGTSALGELDGEPYTHCFIPLIRKNSPIPVSRSEVFYTAYDGQEEVDVVVYQGEDPDARNNIEIGQFRVKGLKDVPRGNQIVATFSLDLDGILQVKAREKQTGLEFSTVIDNAIGRFQGEEMLTAQSRLSRYFEEDDATLELDDRRQSVEAHALLEKAERLLEGASAADREDLVNACETLRDALGSRVDLVGAINVLADLLYYLET